ncbi:MAG: hypothetical protein H0W73_19135 [Bacteroidetes bacterium]|nr:hypothetical protein [Bacteroidota bacterium]
MNKKLVLLFSLFVFHCFSQINKTNFDIDLTKKQPFSDPQKFCSQLLSAILNPDSTNYSLFNNSDILCLLVKEDFEKDNPKEILDVEEICGKDITNKVFVLESKKIRSKLLVNGDSLKSSSIKIFNFSQERQEVKMKTKYIFEKYDLKLFFTDQKSKKTYLLNVTDIFYANKKWFLVEPSYSIQIHW